MNVFVFKKVGKFFNENFIEFFPQNIIILIMIIIPDCNNMLENV